MAPRALEDKLPTLLHAWTALSPLLRETIKTNDRFCPPPVMSLPTPAVSWWAGLPPVCATAQLHSQKEPEAHPQGLEQLVDGSEQCLQNISYEV